MVVRQLKIFSIQYLGWDGTTIDSIVSVFKQAASCGSIDRNVDNFWVFMAKRWLFFLQRPLTTASVLSVPASTIKVFGFTRVRCFRCAWAKRFVAESFTALLFSAISFPSLEPRLGCLTDDEFRLYFEKWTRILRSSSRCRRCTSFVVQVLVQGRL